MSRPHPTAVRMWPALPTRSPSARFEKKFAFSSSGPMSRPPWKPMARIAATKDPGADGLRVSQDRECERIVMDARLVQQLMGSAPYRNALCRSTRSTLNHAVAP